MTLGDAGVIVADKLDRGRVLAVDERAADAGAAVGQTVTQAVAVAQRARVLVHDAAAARARWDAMLDALDAVSPLVDDDSLGVAFLDMYGIAGSPDDWMRKAREVLASFDMPLQCAVAENRFAAYAATVLGDGTILPAEETAARIAALPLRVLRIDPNTLGRIELLGISTLGELARLPHGPFVRRFGREAIVWHDRARGLDATPLVPRGHAVSIEASMFGEGHAEDEAQVMFALRVLLSRICADLERAGKRAGALALEVELDDGDTQCIDVTLATPTALERAMHDVLRAKLEGLTFTSPIVGLRVRAQRLEEGGEDLALFASDEIDPQVVAVMLARLEAALGAPAQRAVLQPAHAVEAQFRYEPFTLERPKRGGRALRPSTSSGWAQRDTGDLGIDAKAETGDMSAAVPQLRLLAVREIDVEVRKGQPAFVGSPPVAVVECAGPWRIDEGWFGEAIVRDEYDVVLEGGEFYRIYRQGKRWYLRGAYD